MSANHSAAIVVLGGDCCLPDAPYTDSPAPDPEPFFWSLDQLTSAWSALPALTWHRAVTCAAGVGEPGAGRGVLAAGDCRSWTATREAFVFARDAREWRRAREMPLALHFASAVEAERRAYVLAEAGVCLCYDAGADAWSQMPTRPARCDSSAVAELGGRVWAVGGTHAAVASVEALDPRAGTWSAAPELTSRRQCAEAVSVRGCLYVVGGFCPGMSGSGDLETVERLDPRAGRWEAVAAMPAGPRWSLSCIEVDGKLLALGGLSDDVYLDRGELYDPVTNAWTSQCPSLPSPRAVFGLARM